MNKRLQLAVRNPTCDKCPIGQRDLEGRDRCVTGFGPNKAKVMVVTFFPTDPGGVTHTSTLDYLKQAGLDGNTFIWTSVIKCRVWNIEPTTNEIKTCTPYLQQEIEHVNPDYILTFGNEPLKALTGHSGVMKYKGKELITKQGYKVFPTMSPVAVMRRPRGTESLLADLRYFKNLLTDDFSSHEYHTPTPDRIHTVTTAQGLRDYRAAIQAAKVASFDIETRGLSEADPEARIISLATTLSVDGTMATAEVWRLPLYHPESPFKSKWIEVLRWVGRYLCKVPKRTAHNGKFDCKWMRHFGVTDIVHTYDTIMALSIVDETLPKSLKDACQQLLGAEPWGVDTKNLLEMPLAEVLEYNGLDTWHGMRLYLHTKEMLKQQPKQARVFKYVGMSAVQEFIDMERTGVYVDRKRLVANGRQIRANLKAAEETLIQWLPDAAHEYPSRFIKKGQVQINWNPSLFARWVLFEHLNLPVLQRGKTKPDRSPGEPSMDKEVLNALKEKHPIAATLLDRAKWRQLDSMFVTPYLRLLGEDSRMRTVFKPWGTDTGRVSAGGEDSDKISSLLDRGNSVNLMQVPREYLVRSVFGSEPGWWFVTADYSQVELRIAAFLAQEPTMLHLYNTGQDIHLATAMKMTGLPKAGITKVMRQNAKPVNFGFLYGMGWAKFIIMSLNDYGVKFTEEQSKAYRRAFFEQYNVLPVWHAKQRRLVNRYGRVETPMGRVRHLPDITSPDEGIRAEAERQAINSPVQAFASDLALLAMREVNQTFRDLGLAARPVGFVHDAINFEVREDHLAQALRIIKSKMEDTIPLSKKFGVHLNVPLVADLAVGRHWADAKEIENYDLLHNQKALLQEIAA